VVVQGKGGTTTGQGTLWRSHPGGVPENNVGITPRLRNLFLHEPLGPLTGVTRPLAARAMRLVMPCTKPPPCKGGTKRAPTHLHLTSRKTFIQWFAIAPTKPPVFGLEMLARDWEMGDALAGLGMPAGVGDLGLRSRGSRQPRL